MTAASMPALISQPPRPPTKGALLVTPRVKPGRSSSKRLDAPSRGRTQKRVDTFKTDDTRLVEGTFKRRPIGNKLAKVSAETAFRFRYAGEHNSGPRVSSGVVTLALGMSSQR
jgi:hypothetical protein